LNRNKRKENREVVWCTLCITKGNYKKEFPTFAYYLVVGFLNPLPIGGPLCEICRTHGHDPYHFPLMKKYQTIPKSTFYNLCKFVGHEDKDCRTLEIMKERTSDAYRMQVEPMIGPFVQQYNNT
jgi:hypothetical protein